MNEKIKAWYDENRVFADDCEDYEVDPSGEMMYDGFVEFMQIMRILKELEDE
jgi:hypothetical protein